MSDKLTIRDSISTVAFDPLTLDTTEIRELSEAIPKDGQIDINQAEILATRFLYGANKCADLLAIATSYVMKCDTEKKKAYSQAAITKASAAGIKTDKSRLLFADGDEDYIAACDKYAEAQAMVKWLSSKGDSFSRAHYLMKQMLNRHYSNEQAAGFMPNPAKMIEEIPDEESEQAPEDDFGKEW